MPICPPHCLGRSQRILPPPFPCSMRQKAIYQTPTATRTCPRRGAAKMPHTGTKMALKVNKPKAGRHTHPPAASPLPRHPDLNTSINNISLYLPGTGQICYPNPPRPDRSPGPACAPGERGPCPTPGRAPEPRRRRGVGRRGHTPVRPENPGDTGTGSPGKGSRRTEGAPRPAPPPPAALPPALPRPGREPGPGASRGEDSAALTGGSSRPHSAAHSSAAALIFLSRRPLGRARAPPRAAFHRRRLPARRHFLFRSAAADGGGRCWRGLRDAEAPRAPAGGRAPLPASWWRAGGRPRRRLPWGEPGRRRRVPSVRQQRWVCGASRPRLHHGRAWGTWGRLEPFTAITNKRKRSGSPHVSRAKRECSTSAHVPGGAGRGGGRVRVARGPQGEQQVQATAKHGL